MTDLKNPVYVAILQALDGPGALMAGQIAKKIDPIRYGRDARTLSSATRSHLNKLCVAGFVEPMDDEKPSCWQRTTAGADFLASVEHSHCPPLASGEAPKI